MRRIEPPHIFCKSQRFFWSEVKKLAVLLSSESEEHRLFFSRLAAV